MKENLIVIESLTSTNYIINENFSKKTTNFWSGMSIASHLFP